MTTETGLPALPEGYFWRVRHHRTLLYTYYGERYHTDTSRLQVELIHRSTETNYITGRKWFRTVRTEDESVKEQVEFVEDAEGTHAIAVRNAANRIMKQWEKAKVRDALVGDYPPKTLEVS